MAAYGAAVSLKNTARLILGAPRIGMVPPYPKILQFLASCCAVLDRSYLKVVTAAYSVAVCLNYTNPSIQQSFRIPLVSEFHSSYFKWVMVAYVGAVYLEYKMRRLIVKRAFLAKISVLTKAYDAMDSLLKVVVKLEETSCSKIRTKVNELDGQIKEAIWEFEDLLESHVYEQILPQLETSSDDERDHSSLSQILPQLESGTDHLSFDQILTQLEISSRGERDRLSFSVDLQGLERSVDSLVERVTVMEVEYDIELLNMPEAEGEPISSRIDFSGINSAMVGSSDVFKKVRDYLI